MTRHSAVKNLESNLILIPTSHLSNYRKRQTRKARICMLTEVGSSRKLTPTEDAEEVMLELGPVMYVLMAAQISHEAKAYKAVAKGTDKLTYALVEESSRKFSADESPKDAHKLFREWLERASTADLDGLQ